VTGKSSIVILIAPLKAIINQELSKLGCDIFILPTKKIKKIESLPFEYRVNVYKTKSLHIESKRLQLNNISVLL
jgi:hypothetical protein